MSEKGVEEIPTVSTVSSDHPDDTSSLGGDGDGALDFLKAVGTEGNFSQDAGRMKKLRNRIDRRVIPFLFLSYFLNYMDKILLNVSLVGPING